MPSGHYGGVMENAPAPRVSAVVVAFHRPQLLQRALEAMRHDAVEIIVVNVEDDPAIRSLESVTLVPMQENRGYAAGVNAGARRAHADVVAFMNDDVVISADGLLRLAERVRSGAADVVVPLVQDEQGRLELPEKLPYNLARQMLLQGRSVPDEPTLIDSAWAAVVAVNAELLRVLPMPEDYFLYWEEIDWFYRIVEHNARVELYPGVRAMHYGGLGAMTPAKIRLKARNAVRCMRRVRGRRAALAVWPRVVAWYAWGLVAGLGGGPDRRGVRVQAAGVSAALGAWREI